MGLSEIRRQGEKLLTRQNGNYWYYFGETIGYRGIEFYVKSYLKNRVLEIKGINERLGYLKIRVINKGVNFSIIQVYEPTVEAEEEEVENFHTKG